MIPADRKWFMRTAVAAILVHHLEAMDPAFPRLGPEERKAMDEAVAALAGGVTARRPGQRAARRGHAGSAQGCVRPAAATWKWPASGPRLRTSVRARRRSIAWSSFGMGSEAPGWVGPGDSRFGMPREHCDTLVTARHPTDGRKSTRPAVEARQQLRRTAADPIGMQRSSARGRFPRRRLNRSTWPMRPGTEIRRSTR